MKKRKYKTYLNCSKCSKNIIKTSSFQKYCKDCSKVVRREYKRIQERIRMKKPGKKQHLSIIQKLWRIKNKELLSVQGKNRRLKLRLEVLNYYGNKCICCSESNIYFLSIDHINGGGNKHRKYIKIKGGSAFYAWLKKNNFPTGFQVLCHNCNLSKGFYGECPHIKFSPVCTSYPLMG